MTFAVVGALLVIRRPGNAVGWCMVLIGDGYALGGLGAAITASAVADGPAGAATAGLAGWFTVFVTTIGGLVFALGFIFPTGRGHSPAWDRFIRLAAIWFPITSLFVFLIRPGPLHLFSTIDNPFGFGPDLRPFLGPNVSQAVAACSAVVVPLLAFSLVSRYRMADTDRSTTTEVVRPRDPRDDHRRWRRGRRRGAQRTSHRRPGWSSSGSPGRSFRSRSASRSCATACTTSTG